MLTNMLSLCMMVNILIEAGRMPNIVLHQFLYSHYNEKARWALAHKKIAHSRVTYLPGPHMPKLKRLSGQTQTPVLLWNDEVVAGSANILARLEASGHGSPLLPEEAAARQRALDLQADFDEHLGPATRTALFSVLVGEGGYLTRMFAKDSSWIGRGLYRATFPLARPLIAKGNGTTDPNNVERAFATTATYLQQIAAQTEDTGYLVGDTFSIADLTAASLLAPLATLDHPDMKRPQPVPPALQTFYDRWRSHPGINWVQRMYAEHRP